MTKMYSKFLAAAVAAIVGAGFAVAAAAQNAPAAQAQGQGGGESLGYQETGPDQNAAGPSGATRPLEVPVLYVTGVEILNTTNDPKVQLVRVTGLTSSASWSNPILVPFFYGRPADDVLDLQFIATSPEQSQKADGFVPISAIFTLEAGNPFKGVRVRAAANAIELKQMPGVARAEVKVVDCKDCVGKKFAEKGKAAAGTAGVVREEDLPRGFRTIEPTHGVAGQVHNPNRINLILDDNHTVVMAFWE